MQMTRFCFTTMIQRNQSAHTAWVKASTVTADRNMKSKHCGMHVNPMDFVPETALMRTLYSDNTFLCPKSMITYTPHINMEIPPKFTKEDKQLRDYINQNGFKDIDKFLKPILDKWQEVEVNIAIIGDPGAGKSSYINALLEKKPSDPGAAKVGNTETTMVPTCYDHPRNPKLKLWDLPGVGTRNQRSETYWTKWKLDRFHAYLIFANGRFTQNDGKLADMVHSVGKKFFFVRAKMDVDLSDAAHDQGLESLTAKQEQDELFKIRQDSLRNLEGANSNLVDVYLISNRLTDKWDYSRLTEAICDALPSLQRESAILTLKATSTKMLNEKVEILRSRIWKVAALSSGVATIPLPGLSIAFDIGLMINEISRYRSMLGIPEEGTTAFSMLKAPLQQCIRETCTNVTSTKGVQALLSRFAAEHAVEEVSRWIPFVGTMLAGCMSFVCTYKCLDYCLSTMKETAFKVMNDALNIPRTD